jgi:hypothetical protein
MDLHLTDEQAALLVTELDHLIDNDRYPLQEAPMKPYRGPLTTLGNAATAKVRLIVWCRDCQHRVEPDPAEHAARYGAELPVRAWVSGSNVRSAAAASESRGICVRTSTPSCAITRRKMPDFATGPPSR